MGMSRQDCLIHSWGSDSLSDICPKCFSEGQEAKIKLMRSEQQLAEKNAEIVRIKQVNTELEQKVAERDARIKELETWQSMHREGKKLAAQEYHRQKHEIEQLQTANTQLEQKVKELEAFKSEWELKDGNSAGYNKEKAENYGRQAYELKTANAVLEAKLKKAVECIEYVATDYPKSYIHDTDYERAKRTLKELAAINSDSIKESK